MERTPLPAALCRPFDPAVSYKDRVAIWKRWETDQWAAAIRFRGVSLLSVEPEIQHRIVERINESPRATA